MLDFTSALYLGLRHPHGALDPWDTLSTGAPAALSEPARTRAVAGALARLQGCERGVLATSTLHLFWDLFGLLSRDRVAIFLDGGAYPIARWGVERAAARQAAVRVIPHHDAAALRQLLAPHRSSGVPPLIVTDGFCPGCGQAAPLREYLACASEFGGTLIIDDTQALGVLGRSPGPAAPYGTGGGGVLRWLGLEGPDILSVVSLAKGFGAPLAALCGSGRLVGRFERESETRAHCSPPSLASVHAAARAVRLNGREGDGRRQHLAGLVADFREAARGLGVQLIPGLFPQQTILAAPGIELHLLHRLLEAQGIRTVLQRRDGKPVISLLFTAGHRRSDLHRLAGALASLLSPTRSREGFYHALQIG